MEAKGILGRQRDTDDERVVLVQLTEHGLGLRELAKPIPGKLMCQVEMSSEELLILQSTLRGLIQKINP